MDKSQFQENMHDFEKAGIRMWIKIYELQKPFELFIYLKKNSIARHLKVNEKKMKVKRKKTLVHWISKT